MDEKSAEMTKYAANSFIAMKISFMNEIARLCELTGAQVDAVRLGIGSDSRIGKRYLFPVSVTVVLVFLKMFMHLLILQTRKIMILRF